MKRIGLILALIFGGCHPAMAEDASACYLVTDSDARAFCRAKVNKEPGTCYVIKKPDMRAQCLAETR